MQKIIDVSSPTIYGQIDAVAQQLLDCTTLLHQRMKDGTATVDLLVELHDQIKYYNTELNALTAKLL